MTQDEAKRLVAKRAVEFVKDGMVVGLGTGTTATLFIRELAARKLKIRCVASSDASHELAESLGMSVATLTELPELDMYIDGADEIARVPGLGFGLIKGGGGALLREKIVASAAKSFIVVADSTKLVDHLGRFPLPVEVIKMALPVVQPRLAALGLNPKLRQAKGKPQRSKPPNVAVTERDRLIAKAVDVWEAAGNMPGPYLTDEGNYILDCACGRIDDPQKMAAEIRAIVGVVEHGLFLGMATLALVAGENGVSEYRP
jgi:ribose 5-phosphate isomerase A